MKTTVVLNKMANQALLALACALLAAPLAQAELIPAHRRTDWKPGVTYNGGIINRTVVYKTIEPSGASDEAALQEAIDTCPDNQVVQLSAGTFRLSGSGHGLNIRRSNITIRGAGPNSTRITQTSDNPPPIFVVGTLWYTWMDQTPFTSDAVKGSKTVTIANNPGLQIGELVHVNETYDPALTVFNPIESNGQINDYLGWGEGRAQNYPGGSRALSRPLGQAMEIAAIDGNQITFSTPFHVSFRTDHAAHLARLSNDGIVREPVSGVGIEDLSVGYGGGGDGGGNIRFFAAKYSWARNIESDHSSGASFAFDGSFRCELRDSFLHTTVNPNQGGAGYGLVFDTYSADCLAENNISWNFNKVMVMRSSGGGNVIGYNYMTDGWGSTYPNQGENGLNASHMTTPHMELFEGNESFNFTGETRWGNSIFITVFRNQLTTQRAAAPPLDSYVQRSMDGDSPAYYYFEDQYSRRAVGLSLGHYWYNFVGNVLGAEGMQLLSNPKSHYPVTQDFFEFESTQNENRVPMWSLNEGLPADNQVAATVLRHGNFDYVNSRPEWDPTNADHALPDSLYLSAKPAFFGATPWPIVRPENLAAPIAGALPAKVRFQAWIAAHPTTAPMIVASSPDPNWDPAEIGLRAEFFLLATGTGPLTYQWQSSLAGAAWTDLADNLAMSGANSSFLVISNATSAMNQTRFRCVVSNTAGTATSAPVIRRVAGPALRLTMDAGLPKLSWNAVLGRTYRLESAVGFLPAAWQTLTTITADHSPLEFTDAAAPAEQRYYRVGVVEP